MATTASQATISLENTITECFAFEKKCRIAGDLLSLKTICVHIVRFKLFLFCIIFHQHSLFPLLSSLSSLLSPLFFKFLASLHVDFVSIFVHSLCRSVENWEQLNAALQTINKRRNQSKHAIMGSVETAMSYIDTVVWPSKEVVTMLPSFPSS